MDGTGLCIWQNHVPTGKLIIFNRRWGSMLGYQPGSCRPTSTSGAPTCTRRTGSRCCRPSSTIWRARARFYQAMHRMIGKDGKTTWVLDRGRVVERDEQGNPVRVMGTHIDITTRRSTSSSRPACPPGSPHRPVQPHRAAPPLSRGVPGHLFHRSDDFKLVNDNLGHRAGDELLVSLAQRLRHCCGEEVRLGRIGGDEFVLLLPWACDDPRTSHLARQCIDAIATPSSCPTGTPRWD